MRELKLSTITFLAVVLILSGCRSLTTYKMFGLDPATLANKTKLWPYLDLNNDSVPGISYLKAIKTIGKKKGSPLIVAIIDSGIDTDHSEIRPYLWSNEDEIKDNGLDDDDNGYIDDYVGWNFLGNMYYAQSEVTRMRTQLATQLESFSDNELRDSATRAFSIVDSLYNIAASEASKQYAYLIENYNSTDTALMEYFSFIERQNKFHFNEAINPRKIVGDDPNDIEDTRYGNNNVTPMYPDEKHGTHVGGIITSLIRHTNGIRIMPIRTIPDGDEYDKDLALAIRYAVDNGAKIINMSFGKSLSPHKQWVMDAMKYAESKDVLLVHGAGNERTDVDTKLFYPGDVADDKIEFISTFINVGATTQNFDEGLVAPFSNYGKNNVDLFAPGLSIYATLPEGTYGLNSGTSMAAPFVSGVAALIRHFYPSLSASVVKQIILETGVEYDGLVIVPGTNKAIPFGRLSSSGGILNAFNALKRAGEL
ncbi:MAG TPA: S8 family serine peptidase [Cyclobacteriaceae bacterium]|nr:S8 family serine peptidase [Cyclobacteriaceae bacterium]HRJ81025.1 S8 family serine peptidase [Cyclobacteriaceae bacterium]